MTIILNNKEFNFSNSANLVPKNSPYDLELIEPGFEEKTQIIICGGVNAKLTLPFAIEMTIKRTSLLPVAKIYQDKNGKKKLTAYFD